MWKDFEEFRSIYVTQKWRFRGFVVWQRRMQWELKVEVVTIGEEDGQRRVVETHQWVVKMMRELSQLGERSNISGPLFLCHELA